MRRRHWSILFGVVSLLAIGGGVWLWVATREPVYQGRSVSYWIRDMGKPAPGPLGRFGISYLGPDAPPKQAIRSLGNKAIPYLAKAIFLKESAYSQWFARNSGKVYSVAPFIYKYLPRPVPLGNTVQESMGMLEEVIVNGNGGYAAAIPALNKILHGRIPYMQDWAVRLLLRIAAKYHDQEAMGAVVKGLASSDLTLRSSVVHYLSYNYGPEMRPVLPGIVKCLREAHGNERLDAANAAYRIGGLVDVPVQALIEGLKAPGPSDRRRAANQLFVIGPAAKSAIPALERLRGDPDPSVSAEVLLALRRIAPETSRTDSTERSGRPLVTQLVTQLKSSDANVQREAAEQLGRLGGSARGAVPLLMTNLYADLYGVPGYGRGWRGYNFLFFANAVLAIDPSQAANLVALLIPGLRGNTDIWFPGNIPNFLARMGPAARDAMPALSRGLDDQEISERCAWALIKIGGPDWINEPRVFAIFIDSLSRKHPIPSRLNAIRGLGELGETASATAPAIRALLEDENEAVRTAAAAALKQVQPKPATPPTGH